MFKNILNGIYGVAAEILFAGALIAAGLIISLLFFL
jgi:hypothetical protein